MLLWVDDDLDEIAVAMRALRHAQVAAEILVATDGLEALEVLHVGAAECGNPLRPQVIFVDLHMPRVDGFELLRALRELPETRDIPIVVVSSSSAPEDIRRSYELGANSYVVKQIDGMGAGSELAAAARYWTELNRIVTPHAEERC